MDCEELLGDELGRAGVYEVGEGTEEVRD